MEARSGTISLSAVVLARAPEAPVLGAILEGTWRDKKVSLTLDPANQVLLACVDSVTYEIRLDALLQQVLALACPETLAVAVRMEGACLTPAKPVQ